MAENKTKHNTTRRAENEQTNATNRTRNEFHLPDASNHPTPNERTRQCLTPNPITLHQLGWNPLVHSDRCRLSCLLLLLVVVWGCLGPLILVLVFSRSLPGSGTVNTVNTRQGQAGVVRLSQTATNARSSSKSGRRCSSTTTMRRLRRRQ